MRLLRFFFLFFLMILAASAADNTAAARPAASKSNTAAPISDLALEKAIQQRFAKSKISVENFQVKVQGGIATIDGRTAVVQRKATATRLARLAGAKQVRNRVTITDEAKEKLAANLASGRRRAQVKRGEPRTSN
jgi:osmotically-inducible protein OsmY